MAKLGLIATLSLGLAASAQAQCGGSQQCIGWNELLQSLNQGEDWIVCKNLNNKVEDPCDTNHCAFKNNFVQCDGANLVGIDITAENGLSIVDKNQFLDAISTLVSETNIEFIRIEQQAALGLDVCPTECDDESLLCSFKGGCVGDCFANGNCFEQPDCDNSFDDAIARDNCYAWDALKKGLNGDAWSTCPQDLDLPTDPCSDSCLTSNGFVTCDTEGNLETIEITQENGLSLTSESSFLTGISELTRLLAFDQILLERQQNLGLTICPDACQGTITCAFSYGCTGDCATNSACQGLTLAPTKNPTLSPTDSPTAFPTEAPIPPTSFPTQVPTTTAPTGSPTMSTKEPTGAPSQNPTAKPTPAPTGKPTEAAVATEAPTPGTSTPKPTVELQDRETSAPSPKPTSTAAAFQVSSLILVVTLLVNLML